MVYFGLIFSTIRMLFSTAITFTVELVGIASADVVIASIRERRR
jgi:hypothetical protein